jgi:hypothetical protein
VTYLAGHNLEAVAQLLELPDHQNEPGLHALIIAFNALIAAARTSILSKDINVFALHRVNSFLRGRPYSKPLHSKLLDSTLPSGVAQAAVLHVSTRCLASRTSPSL